MVSLALEVLGLLAIVVAAILVLGAIGFGVVFLMTIGED